MTNNWQIEGSMYGGQKFKSQADRSSNLRRTEVQISGGQKFKSQADRSSNIRRTEVQISGGQKFKSQADRSSNLRRAKVVPNSIRFAPFAYHTPSVFFPVSMPNVMGVPN